MEHTAVGVDISKAKFDVAACVGEKYKTKRFANTRGGIEAFIAWLARFAHPHVCLEATARYGEALATALADADVRVSVVNPAQIAAFAKLRLARGKSDAADAKLIARYCRTQAPALWSPLPLSQRTLQALLRRLENLLEMQQMERNRLESAEAEVRVSIQSLLRTLEREIAHTREKIRQHIDQDPDLRDGHRLLQSIPGIGQSTSAWLLSLLGDGRRFRSAAAAAAFAGLTPFERQSGRWRGQTRLAKTGDARLRRALYLPALVAWRHNPVLHPFCERLKARGKNGKAIVCAAMRKLLHIAYGVLKHRAPFKPNTALAA